MNSAIGKASAGENGVYFRHSECQTIDGSRRTAFKRSDAVAQIGNHPLAGSSHRSRSPFRSRLGADIMWLQIQMFSVCSEFTGESSNQK
jgi:hypothetical protein